jgi:hypothetical protein
MAFKALVFETNQPVSRLRQVLSGINFVFNKYPMSHQLTTEPIQGWTCMVQADELNYKASNTAAELRLGHPNPPQDPYTQRPDPGEMGKGFIYGDWKRDAAGQWNRSAADMRHGPSEMRELHQVADSQKTAQLDTVARKAKQGKMAYNTQTHCRVCSHIRHRSLRKHGYGRLRTQW